MRYMDSLNFITKKEGWFMNLLMCAIALIIPVIGPIIMFGYGFEVFDALRRDPARQNYPNFDFNRFSAYLTRGIWPFLVQLVISTLLSVPMGLCYGCLFPIVAAGAGKGSGGGAIVFVLWLIAMLLGIAIGVAIGLLSWPMITYAGVSQRFDFSGMIAYAKEFLRKMLKELVLTMLFLMAIGFVLGIVGYLALCVGIFFVAAAMTLAQYHLKMQLYELYLQRGGTPIPEKPSREYPSDAALAEPPPPPPPPPGRSESFRPEPPAP